MAKASALDKAIARLQEKRTALDLALQELLDEKQATVKAKKPPRAKLAEVKQANA